MARKIICLEFFGKDGTMRIVKVSVIFFVCACVVLANGCISGQQYNELKLQNDTLNKRRAELESEVETARLKLEQLERRLEAANSKSGIEVDALEEKVAALEEDLERKKKLIASMQHQLLAGPALPVELSTMLEDFAKGEEMVSYDASRGIVKFKSDLLFEKGSDVVASDASAAVKSLCGILNLEEAKQFDIIIAGHTDDIPIAKPATREKHPTNWHLSVHRAISVLAVMARNNVTFERISVRGFGEFRPIVPNKPNKKGNPQNRRVEIYIVAKGI